MGHVSDEAASSAAGGIAPAYHPVQASFLGRLALATGMLLVAAWTLTSSAAASERYADLPQRKPGLWEVTVQAHSPGGLGGIRQSAVTVLQCTDAASERAFPLFMLPPTQRCSSITVARSPGGGGHEVVADCQTHGQRELLRVSWAGDMQSVYSGAYSKSYPGQPLSNTGQVPFQARWLGKCQPGQRPGQMVLPNGITVNPVEDQAREDAHVHPH